MKKCLLQLNCKVILLLLPIRDKFKGQNCLCYNENVSLEIHAIKFRLDGLVGISVSSVAHNIDFHKSYVIKILHIIKV